ncbi:hypothetical protein [Silvimonas iriomotensis]|uniref:Uncharacterized protein n=1 Tax=Silvimonas iriomotensis TaxID=449662 RepID=A0ABQ2PBI0_9NEIS|nr:hypothetical protein [Silvimonas iriomotensis]GGP22625.1 hypothetical protein GCM10010970_26290 [Silvimonas iriomotensis]
MDSIEEDSEAQISLKWHAIVNAIGIAIVVWGIRICAPPPAGEERGPGDGFVFLVVAMLPTFLFMLENLGALAVIFFSGKEGKLRAVTHWLGILGVWVIAIMLTLKFTW